MKNFLNKKPSLAPYTIVAMFILATTGIGIWSILSPQSSNIIDFNLLLTWLGLMVTSVVYLFTIKENASNVKIRDKNTFSHKLSRLNEKLTMLKNDTIEDIDEMFIALKKNGPEEVHQKISNFFNMITEEYLVNHIKNIDSFLVDLNNFCNIEARLHVDDTTRDALDVLLAKLLDSNNKNLWHSLSPLTLRYLSKKHREEIINLDEYIPLRKYSIEHAKVATNSNSIMFIPYENTNEARYNVQYFHICNFWKELIDERHHKNGFIFPKYDERFNNFFMMILGIEPVNTIFNIKLEINNGEFDYNPDKSRISKEIISMYTGVNYSLLRKALEYGCWGYPPAPWKDIYYACKDWKRTNTFYSYLSDFVSGQLLAQCRYVKDDELEELEELKAIITSTETTQDIFLVPFYSGIQAAVHLLKGRDWKYNDKKFLSSLEGNLNIRNKDDLPFALLMHCFACKMLGLTMESDLEREDEDSHLIYINDGYNYNDATTKFLFAFRFYEEIENCEIKLEYDYLISIFEEEFSYEYLHKSPSPILTKTAFEKFMLMYERGEILNCYEIMQKYKH